jgi:hypothetical protein
LEVQGLRGASDYREPGSANRVDVCPGLDGWESLPRRERESPSSILHHSPHQLLWEAQGTYHVPGSHTPQKVKWWQCGLPGGQSPGDWGWLDTVPACLEPQRSLPRQHPVCDGPEPVPSIEGHSDPGNHQRQPFGSAGGVWDTTILSEAETYMGNCLTLLGVPRGRDGGGCCHDNQSIPGRRLRAVMGKGGGLSMAGHAGQLTLSHLC